MALSKEHRKAISDSMKIAHKTGRHPGWANANRNNRSYPEKLFEKKIKEYKFFDNYTIQEQFPVCGYFLDFCVLELKCDIEIDGVQHYRTNEARDYDKKRAKKKKGEKAFLFLIKNRILINFKMAF